MVGRRGGRGRGGGSARRPGRGGGERWRGRANAREGGLRQLPGRRRASKDRRWGSAGGGARDGVARGGAGGRGDVGCPGRGAREGRGREAGGRYGERVWRVETTAAGAGPRAGRGPLRVRRDGARGAAGGGDLAGDGVLRGREDGLLAGVGVRWGEGASCLCWLQAGRRDECVGQAGAGREPPRLRPSPGTHQPAIGCKSPPSCKVRPGRAAGRSKIA